MGIHIEDGVGTGKLAQVDANNRLRTLSVNESFDYSINRETQKVWSIPFEGLNPDGADDYILYIKNDGERALLLANVALSADTAATQVKLTAVSGTAAGGADISPVSRTVGSSATPSATIQSGTDITGITDDGVLFYIQLDTVGRLYEFDITSFVRIPKGKAIGLSIETATANITGTVVIAEEGDE